LIVGTIFWLGAINVRFIIGNDLLNYDEFNFRTSIPTDEENMIFKLLSYTSILIMISYTVTLIAAIFFLKKCKINFKENPWVLMCAILFFVFVPVEVYTSFLDLKFYMLFLQRPPNHDGLLEIFGERIGFLKGVPWIAVLSYYTIILIAVLKPLKKSKEELESDKLKTDEYSYKYIMHEKDDF
jgi:amino acid transporter